MNIDSKIAILCITTNGRSLACRIKRSLNYGDIYFINNKRGESLLDDNEVISKSLEEDIEIYTVKKRLKFFVEDIFDKYEYILFIIATGIVVRIIATLITSKLYYGWYKVKYKGLTGYVSGQYVKI